MSDTDYTDNNNFPFTPYRDNRRSHLKVSGKSNADWGFQNPAPGWHTVEYQEGIGQQMKDGEPQYNDKGEAKYIIKAKIVDDDDAGKFTTVFAAKNARGEQTVMDVLENAGLGDHFAKMFPGDVSIFEPAPWQEVQKQLPGRFTQQLLEENKSGFMNIKGLMPVGVKPPEGKVKGGDKAKSESGTGSAPASDWK